MSICESAYWRFRFYKTKQATFPIVGCSEQRAAWGDLVTFHCHSNSLQVTLGELHAATPIYSLGLIPDEPWRMSEQDWGGHTCTNSPRQQQHRLFWSKTWLIKYLNTKSLVHIVITFLHVCVMSFQWPKVSGQLWHCSMFWKCFIQVYLQRQLQGLNTASFIFSAVFKVQY